MAGVANGWDRHVSSDPGGDPGGKTGSALREVLAAASLLAILLFGGMAVGLAIALTAGGGSVGAILVGFLALPLAFGLSMSAWRALLGAWLLAGLARSAARSRGDEGRFREEVVRSLQAIRDRGPAGLPGTWVFVPVTLIVGAGSGLLMAVAAERDGLTAGALILVACAGLGVLLRRLARQGRLPIPEE